jgi:hypothetical protein
MLACPGAACSYISLLSPFLSIRLTQRTANTKPMQTAMMYRGSTNRLCHQAGLPPCRRSHRLRQGVYVSRQCATGGGLRLYRRRLQDQAH